MESIEAGLGCSYSRGPCVVVQMVFFLILVACWSAEYDSCQDVKRVHLGHRSTRRTQKYM